MLYLTSKYKIVYKNIIDNKHADKNFVNTSR